MNKSLIFWAAFTLGIALPCLAQNATDVIRHGEEIFSKTCATGYCHGVRGGPSGAPRLAGRGFDQAYVGGVVTRGVPGTAMASFATRLSPQELVAVVSYVATLNGIDNPDIRVPDAVESVRAGPAFSGEAARGARLFSEALRGFGRCSTCHEVNGFGIPVAAPMANVPASVAELKALTAAGVKTGTHDGESMPVLVLSQGKQSTVFYDLTSAPPVQRSVEPQSVKITEGTNWRHSAVIQAYTDAELDAVLAYLRAVIKH